jgi:hypothetical protein
MDPGTVVLLAEDPAMAEAFRAELEQGLLVRM